MNVVIDYPAMCATVTLTAGEEFDFARLDLAVHQVAIDPVGIWNCDLLLPGRIMHQHAQGLEKLGFIVAGSVSADTNTSIKMRKSLRRSGDGHAAFCA
jgi:hypothetical protein